MNPSNFSQALFQYGLDMARDVHLKRRACEFCTYPAWLVDSECREDGIIVETFRCQNGHTALVAMAPRLICAIDSEC